MLNLPPMIFTYIMQAVFAMGILFSYFIQIVPLFKILRLIPFYDDIPESRKHPRLKEILTRIVLCIFCCTMAYIVPDLGQFLNI